MKIIFSGLAPTRTWPAHSHLTRMCLCATLGLLIGLGVTPTFAGAEIVADDFANGLGSYYWQVSSNQPLYQVEEIGGAVRLSKPVGGGDGTLQSVHLDFQQTIVGDFVVSIDFSDASIDRIEGEPGNQIQLNMWFGGIYLAVVRSDEVLGAGNNHHVWIEPPGIVTDLTPNTATSGTLRMERTGFTLQGFFDNTLIYSGSYSDADISRLSFSLQNNGTNDATSVTFDNFSLVADNVAATPLGGDRRVVLTPPWPNPTSQRAEIAFEIPGASNVLFEIFDVGGRRVRTLLSDKVDGGPYRLTWDGRDESGRQQANGTYLARLAVRGDGRATERTERIVLLR